MPKVLVPGSRENYDPQELIDVLNENGCEPVFTSIPDPLDDAAMIDCSRGLDGVIAGGFPFSRRVFEALEDLRVVARIGVGYDTVDVDAATDHGVMVTITPTANSESVADWALTLLLSVARRIPYLDQQMRAGNWDRYLGPEIHAKTLGIVGLGHIGRCLAKRARAFDMTILAFDPAPDTAFAEAYGVSYVPLHDLVSRADFISVHCPLTPHTHGLIGEPEFELMKPSAYIVNTSRGPVVDEPALIRALDSGRIAGAGLDVFTEEPLDESPLRELDNVVLAPHIAAATHESRFRMLVDAAQNAADALNGRVPVGLVNRDVVPKSLTG